MPFLSWTPYSSTVEDIFAGMHCTIQISAARHVWWGCGQGETRKGNSGWWRKWKNKATLGGFEGINMTPDPGSTGQGARCGGSLRSHRSHVDLPDMLVLWLSSISWDNTASIRRMLHWQRNKEIWVRSCTAALP